MSTIEKLEKHVEALSENIQVMEGKLSHDPENFSLALSIKSLKHQRNELQAQIRAEKLLREREIIELRLKGHSVDDGSVPLEVLGDVSRFLADALISGANQLQHGPTAKTKLRKQITETLDLRLAAISHGSARLFVTGRSAPDLFGNSLMESTIQEAFNLLASETGEELTEKVARLGKRTADSFDKLLQTITSHSLEFSVTWNSPSEKTLSWEGNSEKILRLSNSLESVVENEPMRIRFEGELVTISMKGSFEILDDKGITYKGTFPSELLEHMKEFHIGQHCRGTIDERRMANRVTGYRKSFYSLREIK